MKTVWKASNLAGAQSPHYENTSAVSHLEMEGTQADKTAERCSSVVDYAVGLWIAITLIFRWSTVTFIRQESVRLLINSDMKQKHI